MTADPLDRPSYAELAGLALVAVGMFVTEMTLMRAVAQVTWPPFAYLALSAAMLGGGLAGTVLAVRPAWTLHPAAPFAGGLLVAVGAPLATLTTLRIGLEPLAVGQSAGATLTFVFALLLLSAPFVGLAVTLAALLERHPDGSFGVYAADLAGAGAGGFLALAILQLGVPMAASVAAAIAAGGAALLAGASLPRRAGAAVAGVAALATLGFVGDITPVPTSGKRIGDTPAAELLPKLRGRGLATFDRVDGRVDVIPARPAPAFLIDLGAAVARAPEPDALTTKRRDAASAAFVAKPPEGDVLIIGSGGGYEVARALAWGAPHVDAVEVSAAVVDAALSPAAPTAGRVLKDPRVNAVVDEARSFLERSDKRWSHIVAVHTITNAAVATSAMRLAEDFLLTRESLSSMIAALADDGVLYMTRPRAQIALLADLARAGLVDRGVHASAVDQHLALLVGDPPDPFFAGLLVFTRPVDRSTLEAPPGLVVRPPPAPTGRDLPTDWRPFFHRLSDDVGAEARARLRIEGPALAEVAVAWTGGIAALVALLALVLPLKLRRRRGEGTPPFGLLVVSALLGVGFMLVEIALAQRLTLLCGRPVVAFSAVVGGMLIGAGAGATIAERRRPRLLTALLLSTGGCLVALALPSLLYLAGGLTASSTWMRALLAALCAACVALPLGLGFPALVRATHHNAPGSAPWLYAVNAAAGVGASALYAAIAPWFGLAGTTLLAALAYAMAFGLALRARG